MDNKKAIEVEGLSKVFLLRHGQSDEMGNSTREHWALRDVSFDVKQGQSVGIIGHNGSGKSTLLKVLAGVTKPTSGTVEIDGRIASILDIGAGFHPELSGRENIFLNGQIHGFTSKEIEKKLKEIVFFSGIEKFIDEPVKTYSNGMYLRLAFSIMAHLDFDVYLFDEIMSVGDAEFIQKTQQKLNDLKQSGKTILIVSHNMAEIRNLDLFILLDKGEINTLTNKHEVIDNYLESSYKNNFAPVSTNITLTDFSEFSASENITLKKVEFLQEGSDEFSTDKVFHFIVEFEKLNSIDSYDPILNILDIQGNVILSSTPLISGVTSTTEKGTYRCSCVIPAFLFSYHTYRINLSFFRNMATVFGITEMQKTAVKSNENEIKKSILNLDNLIVFKAKFQAKKFDVDLSSLNLTGGLMPAFDWEVSAIKE